MPDTIPQPSPLRVALSQISGSTSIACWIVLLLPQLIEQWRLKSADGLSIQFISLWFLGDLFNFAGSIWAGLLPEAIILAVWFCIADALMIGSYFYYTKIYPKHHQKHHKHHNKHSNKKKSKSISVAEGSPLLGASSAEDTRRRSSHKSRQHSISSVALEPQSHSVFVKYVLPLIFVVGAGFLGFLISPASTPDVPDDGMPSEKIQIGPQILGYCSAVLYLTARLPQIYRNYQHKSCEGLSLLFFIFSVFANLTYSFQIFFYRTDSTYIKLYMSWILGSLGTTVEDAAIFVQFYMYRNHEHKLDFQREEVFEDQEDHE